MAHTDPKSGGWATKEKLTSAQMNLVRTAINNSPDVAAGGTYAPSAPVILNGTGVLQLGDKLALTSRSVTRHFEPSGGFFSTTEFSFSGGTNEPTLSSLVSTVAQLILPLDLPHGNTLSSVSIYFAGPTANATTPTTLPSLKVFSRVISTGVSTQIGSTTNDVYGSSAAYKAIHAVTCSSLAHTIDRSANIYFAVFNSEGGGGGALSGETIHGLSVTCTVTSQSEWA